MLSALFSTPPTLETPIARAWLFDDSATVVNQLLCPQLDAQAARFLVGPFDQALITRYVAQGRKVRSIHDWRACTGYSIQARDLLLDWGRRSQGHTASSIIAISPSASPFLNIALHTGAMVLRGLRFKLEVVNDLDAVVSELGGHMPAPRGIG